MGVAITSATISPQTVKTGQAYKISVDVKITTPEPITYRLPFKLGQKKGGIK